MEKKIHQGRNIKRFREMLGIKQEGLALELGNDWNQRKVSLLEQKEEVEADLLKQVAEVLNVPVKAIENFDEQAAISYINTFNDNSNFNFQCTINPIEKWLEAMDENKRLYEELLKSEREKVQMLREVLDKGK